MTTERHPLDFDALQRGDNLSVERVERAVEVPRTHEHYRLRQMRLACTIREYFYHERGDKVVVRCCGDGVQILTHKEQTDYAPQVKRRGLRALAGSYAMACGVDPQSIDEDRRLSLENFKHVTAFQLQQLRKPPPPLLTDQG